MAKPTTHKLEQKRDSKGSFWKCNRCNTESGASNMGQADAGMGPCISIDTRPLVGHSEPGIVYLETPAERQTARSYSPCGADSGPGDESHGQANWLHSCAHSGKCPSRLRKQRIDFDTLTKTEASQIIDHLRDDS